MSQSTLNYDTAPISGPIDVQLYVSYSARYCDIQSSQSNRQPPMGRNIECTGGAEPTSMRPSVRKPCRSYRDMFAGLDDSR